MRPAIPSVSLLSDTSSPLASGSRTMAPGHTGPRPPWRPAPPTWPAAPGPTEGGGGAGAGGTSHEAYSVRASNQRPWQFLTLSVMTFSDS